MATAKATALDDGGARRKLDMRPSSASLKLSEELRASTGCLNKRSMVLDEEKFQDQFLSCHVCKDRFTSSKTPRLMPCHHSFCLDCIMAIFLKTRDQRHSHLSYPRATATSTTSMACPMCRGNFMTTEDGVKKLPADHRIVQLIDFLRSTKKCTVTFCTVHTQNPLNFFCELCVRPVCHDCIASEHSEKGGHLVIDLEEAMEKYEPILDATVTELEEEAVNLEGRKKALDSIGASMDKEVNNLMDNMKKKLNRLRKEIDIVEADLEKKAQDQALKDKQQMKKKSEQLKGRIVSLKSQAEDLSRAKDENNVQEMFRVHQEVRENRGQSDIPIRELDEGTVKSMYLVMRDESIMISRIQNFIEIGTKIKHPKSPS